MVFLEKAMSIVSVALFSIGDFIGQVKLISFEENEVSAAPQNKKRTREENDDNETTQPRKKQKISHDKIAQTNPYLIKCAKQLPAMQPLEANFCTMIANLKDAHKIESNTWNLLETNQDMFAKFVHYLQTKECPVELIMARIQKQLDSQASPKKENILKKFAQYNFAFALSSWPPEVPVSLKENCTICKIESVKTGGSANVVPCLMKTPYPGQTTSLVAVKSLRSKDIANVMTNEVNMFKKLQAMSNCPSSIIRMLSCGWDTDSYSHIILPYYEMSSLHDFVIKSGNTLSDDELCCIAWSVCQALDFLHSHNIMYRDFSSYNIVLDRHENGSLRPILTDFGTCTDLNINPATSFVGNPETMAPEVANHNGEPYTVKADMFGFGCVMYELMTQKKQHGHTTTKDLHWPVHCNKELKKIALKCLNENSNDRPHAYEVCVELQKMANNSNKK